MLGKGHALPILIVLYTLRDNSKNPRIFVHFGTDPIVAFGSRWVEGDFPTFLERKLRLKSFSAELGILLKWYMFFFFLSDRNFVNAAQRRGAWSGAPAG